MNYSNVTLNIALSKLNYLNLTHVNLNYFIFNPLINSKYFIFCLVLAHFCLIFLITQFQSNYWHVSKKWITSHKIAQKATPQLRCRFCIPLVTSTCNHMVTQITALTTLTPTRKLNGKTRVHTVFYMDSIGQEMPSLVHCKTTVFPLV